MPAAGQRCMQHLGFRKRKKGKLSRACHLRVKETTEMDITQRRARRSPQKKKNKQHIISSFHT